MIRLRFSAVFLSSVLLVSISCSHPDPDRLMRSDNDMQSDTRSDSKQSDSSFDTLAVEELVETGDIDEAIDRAEYFYARGVQYFQQGKPDSAQEVYEEALFVLSELDIDPDQDTDQSRRVERLLREIEQDFRLSLMSTGVLYSESSVAAFRELFDDLKNFKKLKESNTFKAFDKADTVIFDIPIVSNERVDNSLAYLQTVAREAFASYLNRSGKYMPLVEKILEEEGLPHDLAYLPLVESGYNPHAYSRARAVGMWQFMASTGKLYGLRNSWWYDHRRDFEKSTRAAARHLRDLYAQFGNWELALAAYNSGSGKVSRQIKSKKSKDFWKLKLPRETKNYVPLFMAATIIAKQPEKYGFYPVYEAPLEYDSVTTSKCISFNNISAETGIAVADLEFLNPELRRGVTPPDYKEYKLRIPKGSESGFLTAYENIPSEKTTNWATHKIRNGETVSTIARKYGVSIASIVQANNLGRRKQIYAGKTLMIPIPPGNTYVERPSSSSAKVKNVVEKSSNGKYLVREGDTLWDIAVAHGVSVSRLKAANRLSSNKIYAGRWLVIPESGQIPASTTAGYSKYRVRRGDNLWKIANKFNTTIAALKRANGLVSNEIYPGMSLMVPGYSSSDTRYNDDQSASSEPGNAYSEYVIKRGDSLWKIAQKHNVDIKNLAQWNNITSSSKLYPGDKLKIYSR